MYHQREKRSAERLTRSGTELAVRLKPDGYALLSIESWLNSAPTLMKPPYDVIEDIAPIATIACYENPIVIHPIIRENGIKTER